MMTGGGTQGKPTMAHGPPNHNCNWCLWQQQFRTMQLPDLAHTAGLHACQQVARRRFFWLAIPAIRAECGDTHVLGHHKPSWLTEQFTVLLQPQMDLESCQLWTVNGRQTGGLWSWRFRMLRAGTGSLWTWQQRATVIAAPMQYFET